MPYYNPFTPPPSPNPYGVEDTLLELASPALPPRMPRASRQGMPPWMEGAVTIQRGPDMQGVYVPAGGPRVGVMPGVQRGTDPSQSALPAQAAAPIPGPGDPVADFKAQALAAARAPFQVPGGQEYNYGHLTAQQAAYDQGLPAREAKALGAVAEMSAKQGTVQAHQKSAEADMLRAQAEMEQAKLMNTPEGRAMGVLRGDPTRYDELSELLGFKPSPDKVIEKAVPPPSGTPYKTGDEVLLAATDQGLPAPSAADPLGAAVLERYRPELAQSANPGFLAQMVDQLPQAGNGLVRLFGGPELVSPLQARQERARRLLGVRRTAPSRSIGVRPASATPPAEMSYLIGR